MQRAGVWEVKGSAPGRARPEAAGVPRAGSGLGEVRPEGDRGRGEVRGPAEGMGRGAGGQGVARILTPPECGPPCAPRRDRPPPLAARRSHAAAARTAPR